MKVFDGNTARPDEHGAIVTIGTFDGVHRGHQMVLAQMRDWARPLGAHAGVLTFRAHPRKTLSGSSPDMLTSLDHRLLLFERLGADFVWVLDFTTELSRLNAAAFAQFFFADALRIRGLVMGFDSRFGCDQVGGNSPELPRLAARLGFEVRSLEPLHAPEGGIISSTRIRESISDGRLRDAESMLGRMVSVYGTVIKGDARGRRLGFPTANIDLGREVRPPFGVYATVAIHNGKRYGSVTNVGYRPTIAPDLPPGVKPDLLIETHLFDFSGDLYGQNLEVLFVEKLRDERRFPDVAALVEQIRKDEAKARAILQAHATL